MTFEPLTTIYLVLMPLVQNHGFEVTGLTPLRHTQVCKSANYQENQPFTTKQCTW